MMTFALLSISLVAEASPQFQQSPGARQNMDKRRFQFQEFRNNRRLERQVENQGTSSIDREGARKDLSSSMPLINREDKPGAKFNRLSPEERIALRRQIREARQEIYLRQQNQQDKN